MNATRIPDELGREIAHRETRCSDCRMRIKAADDDLEPLCWGCSTRDEIVAEIAAKNPRRVRALVVEHQVPVEYARSSPRPFGLGFGELPSSRITQHLADEDRERLGGLRVAALAVVCTSCTLLGLIVLAVAAIR